MWLTEVHLILGEQLAHRHPTAGGQWGDSTCPPAAPQGLGVYGLVAVCYLRVPSPLFVFYWLSLVGNVFVTLCIFASTSLLLVVENYALIISIGCSTVPGRLRPVNKETTHTGGAVKSLSIFDVMTPLFLYRATFVFFLTSNKVKLCV